MSFKRVLGIFLIFIGLFIILTGKIITGAVIGFSSQNLLSWFGILIIFLGIFIFSTTLEKIVSKKVLTKANLPESVLEAVKNGVGVNNALDIFNESNEKVESGKWIELKTFRVRDTNDPAKYPDSTSLCRYWGPKEYKDYSGRKLDELYKKGEIGKTHEVVRGSDIYSRGGSLKKGNISIPPKASRVLHRHWEIEQMYDYQKNPRLT